MEGELGWKQEIKSVWFTKSLWKQTCLFYDFLLFYLHIMLKWKLLPNFSRNIYEVFNVLCAFWWYLRRSYWSFNKHIFIKNIKILAFALKVLSVLWSHSWLLWNHFFTIPSTGYSRSKDWIFLFSKRNKKHFNLSVHMLKGQKDIHPNIFLPFEIWWNKEILIPFCFWIIHRLFFFHFVLGKKKALK